MSSRPPEKLSRKLPDFKYFGQLWEAGLDLLFPRRCSVCSSQSAPWKTASICLPCFARLYQPTEIQIPRADGRAAGRYEGDLQKLILRAKFSADPLAAAALRPFVPSLVRARVDDAALITYVPGDPRRIRKRGFLLARHLAKSAAQALSLPLHDRILRLRHPLAEQTTLSREERLANLSDAFEVTSPVEDRQIVVVDDVFTTGATAGAVTKALIDAGADRVTFLACAFTPSTLREASAESQY